MSKSHDPERIRAVADELEDAAQFIDDAGLLLPRCLDNGIFTQPMVNMIALAMTHQARLIARMAAAADDARKAADRYERSDIGILGIIRELEQIVDRWEPGRG